MNIYFISIVIFIILILMTIGKLFLPYILSSKIKEHIRTPLFLNVVFSYSFWKGIKNTYKKEYQFIRDNRILSSQKFAIKSILKIKKNNFVWLKGKNINSDNTIFKFVNSIMADKKKFVIAAVLSLGIWSFGIFYVFDKVIFDNNETVITENNDLRDELQQKVDEFVSKANKFASNNDYENAINTYYELFETIEKSNDNGEAFSMLGELMVKSNNGIVSAEAQRQFDKAMRLLKFDERSVYYTAISRMQAKKYEQAIGIWKYLLDNIKTDSKWYKIAEYRIDNISDYTGINKNEVKPLPPTNAAILMRMLN